MNTCTQEAAVMLTQAYQAYAPLLRTHLRRKLNRHPELAEDLLQETFVHAWRALGSPTVRHPQTLREYRPWLLRIASNLAINHYRWAKPDGCPLEEAVPIQASGLSDDPQEVYPHLDTAATVHRVLQRLTEWERRALLLSYQDKVTAARIAQVLALKSPDAAYRLIKRATLAFREAYQQEVSA